GLPEFGRFITGRSRKHPTSAGGTGRGTQYDRAFQFTLSPPLRRRRGRERSEVVARTDSISPKSAFVRADAGGLDRRAPLRDLALDEGLQVLGRAPLGRDQSDPELVHAILERRRVHRFDRRVVELLDDGRGRALRHEEGVPGDGFEVGETLLVR